MIRRLTDAPARSEKTGRHGGHGDHPLDRYLKDGRIPHIWCPGCGIGIAFTAFVKALQKGEFDTKRTVVVSGIGCSGRAAGYLNLDTYHTTHGRAIPFATGLKLANPKLKVVVFSGDGDLFAIGGNHIIHAARRNVDLTVICINNFNYGMTGGQGGPTTPIEARTTTTPYGCAENPFNLIYLAQAAGATYVARWTALHTYEMRDCMIEGMQKRGFSFIEIIVPCPTGYGRRNRLGSDLDLMRYYRDNSYLADELDPEKTALPFDSRIAVGKFVDIEKPTFLDMYNEQVVRRAKGYPAQGKRVASGKIAQGKAAKGKTKRKSQRKRGESTDHGC
jgi:2-oxoglutarate ferredoxin oxidoreductase subunit beta